MKIGIVGKSRYIDADKIDFSLIKDASNRIMAKRLILNQPTADVIEVVRCKDCKHYSLAMLKCCFPLDDKHTFDEYVPPIWQPNDYCSYGERREKWN